MNQIADRVSEFIIANLLLGRQSDLAATPSFLEAGIIDSTGVLELVQFLEETWAIEVTDAEMLPDNLDSLDKIERFVRSKTLSAAAQ